MDARFYPHIANLPSKAGRIIVFNHALRPLTSHSQQDQTPRWPSNDLPSLGISVATLKDEHRKINQQILALSTRLSADKIALQRLKKRKMILQDEIQKLESFMLPDIIA